MDCTYIRVDVCVHLRESEDDATDVSLASGSASRRDMVFRMPASEAASQLRSSCVMRRVISNISSSCLSRVSCSLAKESSSPSSMASTMRKCWALNCSLSVFKFGANCLARSRARVPWTRASGLGLLVS